MTVPDYQTLMRPVLEVLRASGPLSIKVLVAKISDQLGLTQQDRALTTSSGVPLIQSRLTWTVSYLGQAGAISKPARGVSAITERGARLLVEAGDRITNVDLSQFEEFRSFLTRARAGTGRSTPVFLETHQSLRSPHSSQIPPVEPLSPLPPQELIEQAVAENRAAVESELQSRVLSVDPETFERLVLNLLQAMGYGRSGRIEHSGKSGDGGIDGIISQDPLGLDRVYMQAKHYARDNVVQRPAIQGFVGALLGAQGDRGVFITTSSFSAGARQEADKVNARIVLIDGDRLAELMVLHGVGVQAEWTAVLHRIDEDFFDTL